MIKKIFRLKRLLKVIIICLITIVIASQLIRLQSASVTVRNQQTEQFSQSLTKAIAANAAHFLSENKLDQLQEMIGDLKNDSMVRDVTIYNTLGETVAQSKNSIPLPELLNLSEDDQAIQEITIRPYVEELRYEDKKIGYIRLSLEQDKLLALINNYQEHSFNTLILISILIFITGLLVMSIFHQKCTSISKTITGFFQKNKSTTEAEQE
ncbi:AhpA/YtjB family protein [Psychromonas aquatilis]|uniref:AhpA/YtjB family protein n=1 Tax=Psychromonas aquatilis TaxID=2005072 RepID=A0ABU9GQ26_9GAMM